jgi:hypothetical protein
MRVVADGAVVELKHHDSAAVPGTAPRVVVSAPHLSGMRVTDWQKEDGAEKQHGQRSAATRHD